MRHAVFRRLFLILANCAGLIGIVANSQPKLLAQVTNVTQFREMAAENPRGAHRFKLEGDVWWANPAQHTLVLHDSSGAEALQVELADPFPRAGQRVRLEGTTTITPRGHAVQLGASGPVVDNNGVHALIEKSGAVYLEAGRQPFRVEWFNGREGYGLEVEYEGPSIPRQKIPGRVLFRAEWDPTPAATNDQRLVANYYEVPGETLPDFSRLTPIKTGTVTNLSLADLPRPEHIGAVFAGTIEVTQPGLYQFHLKSDDGSRLYVGKPSVRCTVTGNAMLPHARRITAGQMLAAGEDRSWVEVEGKVTLVRNTSTGLQLELTAGAGHMLVEIGDASGPKPDLLLNMRIRAVGFCRSVHTGDGQQVAGILLVPSQREITPLGSPTDPKFTTNTETNANGLPLLTTASEVHRLKREEARRAYPVRLQGVVTCVLPEHQAFILQDGTRGIYVVDFSSSRPYPPQPGEYLEVEGTTDPGLFAPFVNARHLGSRGAGRMPGPVKPTWDQIINGSLDAQQVELQGVVTAVQTNGLTLLMRGGVIRIELRLSNQNAPDLQEFENALVRLRGCLFASWDYVTHQVRMGDVRIYAADILVDQPAPEDLFSSPRKTAGELLLFDPQASVFQRVKVSGQIVHIRPPEHFLMDGERGLRFITKQPVALEIGDTVEVVGFPDLLGSASPVLREAVTRKASHAPLPKAKALTADTLVRADHDATRVKVEGKLTDIRRTPTDIELEMQHGVRTFAAHLRVAGAPAPSLAIDSRLELTGVYAGLGGNRAAGQDIATFELLLQSPSDIKVLARPPWWTLKRLLVIVGALATVLAAAALWITQLHRQVEERTAELGAQIQQRQRAEHQHAMEQERARIAQDLHDELGSGITEISMLAARARSASAPEEKRGSHLDLVGDKARQLVTALDEIVWATNPHHDSLASLVSYFSLYADRFLGLANISWRLDGAAGAPDYAVNSRLRHQLFLVFKEALNNVVRHSGATEVRVGLQVADGRLKLSIRDNGRGFAAGARTEEMDGIRNMRTRIEKLGGRFEISSEAGHGTTLRCEMPTN